MVVLMALQFFPSTDDGKKVENVEKEKKGFDEQKNGKLFTLLITILKIELMEIHPFDQIA